MDLEISEPALDGLRQLYGTVASDVSKKIIFNSVKQALTSKPSEYILFVIDRLIDFIELFSYRHSIQTRTICIMPRSNQTS